MKKTVLFFLTILLCAGLAACAPKEPPEAELPPVSAVPLSYMPFSQGTMELTCHERWEVYIEERPPERLGDSTFTVGTLLCRDLNTDETIVLDELMYGSEHDYWDTVQLFPFDGVLGCDGFIFSHQVGMAFQALDFYAASDGTAPVRIAKCNNTLYTADLDSDGCLELLTNYHSRGYVDLFWTEDSGSTVRSCSLNSTAHDFLELGPEVDWVSLVIDEESGALTAVWTTGGSEESRELDPAALLDIEKNRPAADDLE